LHRRHSRLLLFFSMIVANLAVSKAVILLSTSQGAVWLGASLVPYLIPTALAPLLTTVMLGRSAGLLSAFYAAVLNGLLWPRSFSLILVVGVLSGCLAVSLTQNVRKRSQIIRAGLYVGLTSATCAAAIGFLGGDGTDAILQQALWAAVTGIGTGVLANMVLPILESVFSITTNLSWLEMADLNHPLLQRLTIQAPGTYHHSLVVANLAESAALAIGANALQCRVSGYFHDVGKITKPDYFTENQHGGENPHDDLTPNMSALVVMAHVKDGVDLAIKNKLAAPVIDAIAQHHGTTLVSYFHSKALRQQKDAIEGVRIMQMCEDDVPDVSEQSYRYAGPKPQSKETAILMIADAAEAATRSLDKPTPQRIEEFVKELMRARIDDGQFDECPITMGELNTVAERLAFTLKTVLHGRISYPKRDHDDDKPDHSPKGTPGLSGAPAHAA